MLQVIILTNNYVHNSAIYKYKCMCVYVYMCVCMYVCSHVCSLSGVFVVIFRPYVAFLAKNWKVGWLKWRIGCL